MLETVKFINCLFFGTVLCKLFILLFVMYAKRLQFCWNALNLLTFVGKAIFFVKLVKYA